MFGNADCLRDPAPVHMRNLAADINRERAVRLWCGDDRARLHARRNQAVIDHAETDDLVRFLICLGVVASLDLVEGCYVARYIFVKLRRALLDGGRLVGHRGQHLIIDVDQTDCVVGLCRGLRHHQRHAFSDKANMVGRDHWADGHLAARNNPVGHDRTNPIGKRLAGKNQADSGRRFRLRQIDAADRGVCMWRSENRHVQHARQSDVVDVAAPADEQFAVLASLERLADEWFSARNGHTTPPFDARLSTARTML